MLSVGLMARPSSAAALRRSSAAASWERAYQAGDSRHNRSMARSDQLGEFVRTRRARVSPDRVGLDAGARRRVPGLRREELAQLTHVSVDYVVRLEQGRIGRPSDDILAGLARALLLDAAERRHLFRLAAAGEPMPGSTDGTEVRPGLALVVQGVEPAPAVLLSRRLDLLVWNPTAEALLGPFGAERNYARLVFGDPATRALHADWEAAARQTVSLLRFTAARYPDDHALHELIAELRLSSPAAARWWESHDVAQKRYGRKRYLHPTVGELTLSFEALLLPDDGDQLLTIYAAEPHTLDAERLTQLARESRAQLLLVAAGDDRGPLDR
jgi:transcriptional regulator with XRE-family HTH domain